MFGGTVLVDGVVDQTMGLYIFSFVKKGQKSDVRHIMGHIRHLELIHVERAIWCCESSIPRKIIEGFACEGVFYDTFRVKSRSAGIQ